MIGISGACSRLAVDIVQAFRIVRPSPARCLDPNPTMTCKAQDEQDQYGALQVDDLMVRDLTSVFGMQKKGKINKERARWVVEQLGLGYSKEEEEEQQQEKDQHNIVDIARGNIDDGFPVGEGLSGLDELLHEAFKIFAEDYNGYIDALELERVPQGLGLDQGWDM